MRADRRRVAALFAFFCLSFGLTASHRCLAAIGNTVATVSIATTPTAQPTDAEIEAAVREAVALAGGLPAGIGPGKKIIVHPNLVEAGWPSGSGVVTNKTVIRTVVRMCIEMGASPLDITICEGSAGFLGSFDGFNERKMTWKAFRDVGLNANGDAFEDETGARLLDANDVGATYPNFPDYSGPYNPSYVTIIQNANFWINRVYAIPNAVATCDYLIRIPALKNHNLAGVTGALKLAFGHAAADIYHLSDMKFYKWNLLHMSRWGDDELTTNSKGMADMTMARKPDFVVMDGLVGVTNGPTGGGGQVFTPSQGKMRSIMASTDPVAIDTIEALSCLYKTGIESVPGLTYAMLKGLGTNNPALIHVTGKHVVEVRRNFPAWGSADPGNPIAPTLSDINVSMDSASGYLRVAAVGASDADPGLCKAELSINGLVVHSASAPGYATGILMKGASPGDYTVKYTLYDGMLNETSKAATVSVPGGEPVKGALSQADWAGQLVGPVVYTGATPCIDKNTFFVSSEDGTHGLRVKTTGLAPQLAPGTRITLTGKLAPIAGQRVLRCDGFSVGEAAAEVAPLYMYGKTLGGNDLNAQTLGIPDGWGPYNVGCLVRTSGQVSERGSGWFVIDDTSLPGGLKVLCGSTEAPAIGSLAIVTGLVCVDNSSGQNKAFLAMRSADDLDVY